MLKAVVHRQDDRARDIFRPAPEKRVCHGHDDSKSKYQDLERMINQPN